MTSLLYVSYSSGLNEDDKLIIDRQVSRNRKKVRIVLKTLASNAKDKTKKVIGAISLGGAIYVSSAQPVTAIGLHRPPTTVVRVQSNYKNTYEMKIAPTVGPKLDKIIFIKSRELPVCIYMVDKRFLRTSETSKPINKIRGGSLIQATAALVVIIVVWQILGLGVGSEGFVPNRGWVGDRPNPFQPPGSNLKYPPVYDLFSPPRPRSSLEITRPSSIPNQEFVGLTKEEKRSLPHSHDMKIISEGRPELTVGFWQSKFKVSDHGAVHDLTYTVKSNGKTKTKKTDDNTLKMMRSIVDMPNRNNVEWFEDGTYQRGTNREFEAILIYDLDKKVIAVFKKSTGKFVTTCQLNRGEDNELRRTGNFGGEEGWYSGQIRNLPPQQTAVNTFESDITGTTPISPMNENSSPGFTPTSSFENDVMGITPIDKSQFDNP